MKTYKKVKLEAANAPSGSYAAGCPEHTRHGHNQCYNPDKHVYVSCRACEVAA